LSGGRGAHDPSYDLNHQCDQQPGQDVQGELTKYLSHGISNLGMPDATADR
jgi:hypothetical protein